LRQDSFLCSVSNGPVVPAAGNIQGDTKKRELLKNPTKIEEIQEKKFIDRN